MRRAISLGVLALLLTACGDSSGSGGPAATPPPDPSGPRTITVTSPAFDEGGTIPKKFTCQGAGTSPPLHWSGVDDDRIASVTLIVDDPDAPGGDYVHWIVNGIFTPLDALEEGTLPEEAQELTASGGRRWSPPCPPSGTHHYRFTVLAFTGETFSIEDASSPEKMVAGLMQHASAWGRLTGTVTASGGDSGGGY